MIDSLQPRLSRLSRPRPASVASGLAGGLAVGAVTNVLQGVLPGSLQHFANSGAVWVVAAFVAGALVSVPGWRAVAAGTGTQVGAVVGYYAYAEFVRDGMGDLSAPGFWLALAFVAGPLFGTAGAWLRDERRGRRVLSAGLLGGVFAMEGFWSLWRLHYLTEGAVLLVVAALPPLVLGRSTRDRILGLLTVVPLGLLAFGVYTVLGSAAGLG